MFFSVRVRIDPINAKSEQPLHFRLQSRTAAAPPPPVALSLLSPRIWARDRITPEHI